MFNKAKRRMWVLPSPTGSVVRGEKSSIVIGRFIYKILSDSIDFSVASDYLDSILKTCNISMSFSSASDFTNNILRTCSVDYNFNLECSAGFPTGQVGVEHSFDCVSSLLFSCSTSMYETVNFETDAEYDFNYKYVMMKLRAKKSAIFKSVFVPYIFKARSKVE